MYISFALEWKLGAGLKPLEPLLWVCDTTLAVVGVAFAKILIFL
jgi:hypothetical protein